ncbi:MAG: serine hydrolase [Planctomycetota bacterium]
MTVTIAGVMAMCVSASLSESRTFDIPRVEEISIDGDLSDWSDQGFEVRSLAGSHGWQWRPSDFDVTMRLGWDDEGLRIAVSVRDDDAEEHNNPRRLFLSDSVEFFVAPELGPSNFYMYLVSPGLDPRHPDVRAIFFDKRELLVQGDAASRELSGDVACSETEHGYTLEVMLPWSNTGLVPEPGKTLGFQVYAMDKDTDEPMTRVSWHPSFDTHKGITTAMQRLRLAESPSPVDEVAVRGSATDVVVASHNEYAGAIAEAWFGREIIATTRLVRSNGRASGLLRIPASPGGEAREVDIYLRGDLIERVRQPGRHELLASAVERAAPGLTRHVITGSEFPTATLEFPGVLADLGVEPRLRVRYFDGAYNEVSRADSPGRYGAVIELDPGFGPPIRRFATIYRVETGVRVSRTADSAPSLADEIEITLPGGGRLTPGGGQPAVGTDERSAVSLAASRASAEGASEIEDTWWIGLKRVLYGLSDRPLVLPAISDDPLIPKLVEGTPEQAGMDPDVIASLEQVCEAWTRKNGGQGYVVCAARNGVVFFHRAYGEDDGEALTIESPCDISSHAKMFSGVIVSMFADQGLIELDEPFGVYHPAFRDLPTGKRLTQRMLHTHTSGIAGLDPYAPKDQGEQDALFFRAARSPVDHIYSGRAISLSMRSLELMSGKRYRDLVRELLVEPLGLTGTEVLDAHRSGSTTALDLARLAQMLLNGGRFGGKRYLSPEMVEQMKPRPLVEVFGEGTREQWGIGLYGSFEDIDLELPNYGHLGSSGYLRVDPVNRVIVSIVSREDWKFFTGEIRERFLSTIEEHTRD